MKIYLAIDDTDILGSRGTGHLAEDIRRDVSGLFSGRCENISRHQLFVSDEIPYTSHNSAMCFTAEIEERHLDAVKDHTIKMLGEHSAEGSDPGFCIFDIASLDDGARAALMEFGYLAKRKVLTKGDAYGLAARLGIHLSEHGGTGQGVIGALAGTGLRLEGNDGRFRGWIHKEADMALSARECLERFPIRDIVDLVGESVPGDAVVRLAGKVKTVPRKGMQVLLVKREGDGWINLPREEIKALDRM